MFGSQQDLRSVLFKGFLHFSAQVKHMLAIVAVSSSVADSVLEIINEDGRVVLQLEHIEDEISVSLSCVASLSDFTVILIA